MEPYRTKCAHCGDSEAVVRDADTARFSGKSWVDCDKCGTHQYRTVTLEKKTFFAVRGASHPWGSK